MSALTSCNLSPASSSVIRWAFLPSPTAAQEHKIITTVTSLEIQRAKFIVIAVTDVMEKLSVDLEQKGACFAAGDVRETYRDPARCRGRRSGRWRAGAWRATTPGSPPRRSRRRWRRCSSPPPPPCCCSRVRHLLPARLSSLCGWVPCSRCCSSSSTVGDGTMVDVRSTVEGSEGDRRSRRPVWRVLRIFSPPFFLYL